jgi:hypothetical protein
MGWMVQGSHPGGGKIFRTCPDWPWGPPSFLYNGYRVFPGGGVKSGQGVMLTPHPLLVPLVMKEKSCTSTPPIDHTACTRVPFTFYTVWNQNYVHKGIENSVNSGNIWSYSFQNLFVCHLSINLEIKVIVVNLLVVLCGCEIWSSCKGRTELRVWEEGAQAIVWT